MLFTDDRDNATIQAALKAGVSAYVVAGMQPERLQPILDVAVARFEQERALRDELQGRAGRLAERKLIERAKGILMQQKNVAEDEAFRMMRKLAMDRNRRLVDVAQQIIDVAELGDVTRLRLVRAIAIAHARGAVQHASRSTIGRRREPKARRINAFTVASSSWHGSR